MPESLKKILQALLLDRYAQFKKHLHMRLGSEDLAADVLQETYLKVESMSVPASIDYPSAYLYRMALNIAEDQRKANSRLLSVGEIEELYDMADELAGPERTQEGRSEIVALEKALAELPKRQRLIVIAGTDDPITQVIRFRPKVRLNAETHD